MMIIKRNSINSSRVSTFVHSKSSLTFLCVDFYWEEIRYVRDESDCQNIIIKLKWIINF